LKIEGPEVERIDPNAFFAVDRSKRVGVNALHQIPAFKFASSLVRRQIFGRK